MLMQNLCFKTKSLNTFLLVKNPTALKRIKKSVLFSRAYHEGILKSLFSNKHFATFWIVCLSIIKCLEYDVVSQIKVVYDEKQQNFHLKPYATMTPSPDMKIPSPDNARARRIIYHIGHGKLSSISVRRTFTQNYPYPYSDCRDLPTYLSYLYHYIVKKLGIAYRQRDCFELFIQQEIRNKCKCYALKYLSLSTNVMPCLSLTELNCIDQQENLFNAENVKRYVMT